MSGTPSELEIFFTNNAILRNNMPTISADPPIQFRRADLQDLPAIVRLLANDPLGSRRESYTSPLSAAYLEAFAEIDRDPHNELVVAEHAGEVIGVLQLTYIRYLTFQGGRRAQIEGVRVDQRYRGQGIGRMLFQWAIERARQEGCHLVQLTTNKERPEALEFYLQFGFTNTHEGLKLYL
jgi:GNAT superfamily N-acetyltransferase